MLKIRRPLGRLIFNMGIAIPGKTVFLIETAPWFRWICALKETALWWDKNHIWMCVPCGNWVLFYDSVPPYYTPRTTKLLGGYTGFTPSVRPSVRLSVRPSVRPSLRPSRMPCPLCIIYSYGWILFILGTNDHYHERVCRAPWPLTLTYIFKVIWPWLRKSCPLCSVYSSGWILSIFGTNDHYH